MRRTSTNSLLVIALAISASIAIWGLVDPAGLGRLASAAVATQFESRGWFIMLEASGLLFVALFLAFSRFGRIRLGPENEPKGIMREFLIEYGFFGYWGRTVGVRYTRELADAHVDVLCISAIKDKESPPKHARELLDLFGEGSKRFVLLDKANGFLRDYGHLDMVISEDAQAEVWPLIADWMRHPGADDEILQT